MLGTILHSLIIAEVIGLYLMITAIIMLSRADYYRAMIAKIKNGDHAIPIGSSITLFFGLTLVVMHNVWSVAPPTLVTVVCWLVVIKSLLWLSVPEFMIRTVKRMAKTRAYFVTVSLYGLLGIVMLSRGYYLFSSSVVF